MVYRKLGIAVLALTPTICNAICLAEPLHNRLRSASTIFIATLVEGKLTNQASALQNGKDYRVNFSFVVKERIKGDPKGVSSIYTVNLYRDPNAAMSWQAAEEIRLTPGDNILVIANKPGDIQVGACSQSMPWDSGSDELQQYKSKSEI